MHVDVASRAPHARKHGSTFAETWKAHDGTVFVGVGRVFAGKDRVAVADLLRTAGRAVIGSMAMMANALRALDTIVQKHAREQRDDELAATVAVLAIPPASESVSFVGAGQIHVALLDGLGAPHPLHGLGAALGTGIEPRADETAFQVQRLHRDDLLVTATFPIPPGWWSLGRRTADALVHASDDPEASAAVSHSPEQPAVEAARSAARGEAAVRRERDDGVDQDHLALHERERLQHGVQRLDVVRFDQQYGTRAVLSAPHAAQDGRGIELAHALGLRFEQRRELLVAETVDVAAQDRDELRHIASKLLRMPFESLAAFVRALRAAGELAVIDAEVDPRLEIAEITDRVVKAGGPALLFRSVRGSAFPVLTNQFGTERRAAMALRARTLAEVEARMRRTIDLAMPQGLGGKLGRLASLAQAGISAIPRRVERAAVQEVVLDPPDLASLPVLTTWPLDGGPFITLPLVFTRDPETRRVNVGMYRVQIYDGTTAGMHWQRHKQGRAHAAKWGRRIPVVVAVGGDPALTYAASAPLPPIVDELAFAGFLRGAPVRIAKALTVDLDVPADADFVIEGWVDNDELRVEGPFGDHTGVYSAADLYPTLHVTAITHRRDAIWGATVVG